MFDLEKAKKQKTKIQKRILDLSDEHKFMLLNLITGSGKTLASLNIANKFNGTKWLILCKETNHIEEWKKEIKKHKIKIDCEIICYASLHKIKGNYNIICDEAHAITVSKRNIISKQIKYDRIIFLTATLPDNKYQHLNILSKNKLKVLTLDLNKAIELGILPVPQLNVFRISMSKTQLEKYKKIDQSVKNKSWEYNEDKSRKNYESLMFIANKRKSIVANFKIQKVKALIIFLRSKKTRFICFCNSIDQLDIIKGSSKSYIHSKSDKKNQRVIDDFNKKKYNELFTVKMLTESANLVDIHEGIIVQLDKEPLTAIQRIGRVLRATVPVINIYCVKDTMDEYYLNNSLQSINKKYIKYHG